MKFKLDKILGYKYAYEPKHKLANKSGKVYEHVYVMVEHIGRVLYPDECVHHIDRNRTNNTINNLLLLTNTQYTQLHWLEKEYIPEGSIKSVKDLNEKLHLLNENYVEKICPACQSLFDCHKNDIQQYCSRLCYCIGKRKIDISKEELEKLVWEYPTTEVAKRLGISDVAVAKRCKKLNINKPPRGYWTKKKANKL